MTGRRHLAVHPALNGHMRPDTQMHWHVGPGRQRGDPTGPTHREATGTPGPWAIRRSVLVGSPHKMQR